MLTSRLESYLESDQPSGTDLRHEENRSAGRVACFFMGRKAAETGMGGLVETLNR